MSLNPSKSKKDENPEHIIQHSCKEIAQQYTSDSNSLDLPALGDPSGERRVVEDPMRIQCIQHKHLQNAISLSAMNLKNKFFFIGQLNPGRQGMNFAL